MKYLYSIIFVSAAALLLSCSNQNPNETAATPQQVQSQDVVVLSQADEDTPTEAKLRAMGMVDIAELDSSISVHLVYATPYNFLGKVLYHDLNKAFMLPELAEKVVNAQRALKKIRPDLNLLIYDAARPVSVQREMWDMVKGTEMSEYVGNPNKGTGLHNFGAAVDLTLMDCTGRPLPMGSEYDYFGDEAHTTNEQQLLQEGRITKRELENRLLLRKVMTDEGLRAIPNEWWHFNLVGSDVVREKYDLIDF